MYWTIAYDELFDTIFIPEMDMTFSRFPDTPVPDMRVLVKDVALAEPKIQEQSQEPEATLEELFETPFKETVNEPEK